ncbi:transcriptional regulator [Roseibium polysiphoniae]|uniref:Transcriptional regulator n=1 Tax=Roseibium polysiphoniae TaxID=2571221 RepID=A0A944C883_9HYPH|nr:metalloregulator ArsR/SmtB family transcription factor [Roseibium polysiphoniae]MBS8259110.1 transcriptional regulator [Roseibium polysiphoniae]
MDGKRTGPTRAGEGSSLRDSSNECGRDTVGQDPNSDLSRIFRALGHPARIAIIEALANRPDACCGDIVQALPLAQSTVSQHLQVLKEAGLLTCCTRGRCCHYDLDVDRLHEASAAAETFFSAVLKAGNGASAPSSTPPAAYIESKGGDTADKTEIPSGDTL